jgi:hypothetical protein
MIWKFPFRNGLSNSEESSNFLKIPKTNYFTKNLGTLVKELPMNSRTPSIFLVIFQ